MVAANKLKGLIKKLDILAKTDKIERRVFQTMLGVTSERIFSKGLDANNSEIGKYSKGYIKTRAKNNLGTSSKVILQFKGTMVNDFSLIVDGNTYGLGFKNTLNADKSRWVEDTYDKEIFKHTQEEEQLVNDLFVQEVKKVLN